ncbi:MAG: LamG-like jellyroll fold domain-containing protein [Planctomycetia bacterium]|nr:LamG-like jellyroll fold domain-containing protein [Planctomycetia bacterium]
MNDDSMKLIADLVEGKLTQESGEVLLDRLKDDEDLRNQLLANLLIDNMIKKKYSSECDLQTDFLSLRKMVDLHLSREEFLNSSYDQQIDYEAAITQQDSRINTSIVRPDPVDLLQKDPPFSLTNTAHAFRLKISHYCYEKRWGIAFALTFLWTIGSLLYMFCFNEGTNRERFRPVARITDMINTQWSENERSFKQGQYIEPGKIVLKSGKARIIMENDTELILEGPAEFVINSPMSVYCNEGKLSAAVPKQAAGFEIMTPFGKFTDRGTEFAVSVNKNEARLDVIKGIVDTSCSSTLSISPMIAGSSLKINQYGQMKKIDHEKARFINREQFQSELTQYVETKKSERLEETRQADSLPDLLVRFDFSQHRQTDQIENSALQGKLSVPFAQLTDTGISEGPFFGSNACSLMKETSVVKANLACKPASLTLSARVRIDRLNKGGNALFASESYRSNQGGILWQILASGQLQLQIRQSNKENEYFATERLEDRDLAGTWSDFAAVIDHVYRKITLYLDGKKVYQGDWKQPVPILLDNITIGNISTASGKFKSSQSLSGAIQEFRVYSKALSEKEIRQISQH